MDSFDHSSFDHLFDHSSFDHLLGSLIEQSFDRSFHRSFCDHSF